MVQTGYVVEVTDNGVKVRVDRESACGGNCVSCKGCPTSAVIVECTTLQKVEVGDEVRLVMRSSSFFKKAALGYGALTVLMIIGAVAGYCVFKSEGASVLGMLVGIALGLFFLKIGYKKSESEIEVTKIYTQV